MKRTKRFPLKKVLKFSAAVLEYAAIVLSVLKLMLSFGRKTHHE